jgi:hypothetical protein
MTAARTLFHDIVHARLVPAGFVAKRGRWHRVLPEIVQVVEVVRERNWSQRYGVCFGASARALNDGNDFKALRLANIYCSGDPVPGFDHHYFNVHVMDLASSVAPEERRRQLELVLDATMQGFLAITSSIEGIVDGINREYFRDKLLNVQLQKHIADLGYRTRSVY